MIAETHSEEIYKLTMNIAAKFIQRRHRDCADDILQLIDNVAAKMSLTEFIAEERTKLVDTIGSLKI